MASLPKTDFQICLLCKEMCCSAAPLSSSSSAPLSSSQTSTSSVCGGGPGAAARRLHVLPCLHAFCQPCLEAHRLPANKCGYGFIRRHLLRPGQYGTIPEVAFTIWKRYSALFFEGS